MEQIQKLLNFFSTSSPPKMRYLSNIKIKFCIVAKKVYRLDKKLVCNNNLHLFVPLKMLDRNFLRHGKDGDQYCLRNGQTRPSGTDEETVPRKKFWMEKHSNKDFYWHYLAFVLFNYRLFENTTKLWRIRTVLFKETLTTFLKNKSLTKYCNCYFTTIFVLRYSNNTVN